MSERTKAENKAVMADHYIGQYQARVASESAEPEGADDWRYYYIPLRPEDAWQAISDGRPVRVATRSLHRTLGFLCAMGPFRVEVCVVDDDDAWIRPHNEVSGRPADATTQPQREAGPLH